jgi:hypothetical protein
MTVQDGLNFLVSEYPWPTTIKIVCGWHKRYFGTELIMGYKDGKGKTGTSHGICPDCADKLTKEK